MFKNQELINQNGLDLVSCHLRFPTSAQQPILPERLTNLISIFNSGTYDAAMIGKRNKFLPFTKKRFIVQAKKKVP